VQLVIVTDPQEEEIRIKETVASSAGDENVQRVRMRESVVPGVLLTTELMVVAAV
jgi:hypothetical protein